MAQACNLSYSGSRDQEDRNSKPSLGKEFMQPYLGRRNFTEKELVEWLEVKALSSNPSTTKTKRKVQSNRSVVESNMSKALDLIHSIEKKKVH
jgi:hypothetical protein